MFESKKFIAYVENCQYKLCKDNIQTFNRVSYNLTKDIIFFNMFETQKMYSIYKKNGQFKPCKDNLQTFNRVSYNLTNNITVFNMFET